MPITSKFDRAKNLTIFTVSGDVTFDELAENLTAYIEAGPTRLELYDFSEGTGNTVNFEHIAQLVEIQKTRYPRVPWKTAFVVHRDVGFKMTMIYKGMAEVEGTAQRVKVFRSLDDAYDWLEETPEDA
jgi:hypothetical protein